MKRWAKCVASRSSMPPATKRSFTSGAMTRFGSRYSGRSLGSLEMYVELDA